MRTPSTIFQAVELTESRNTFITMPTPDINVQSLPDGSITVNGQKLTDEQTLNFLREQAQRIEAKVISSKQDVDQSSLTCTTVSQATDDCDGYPAKIQQNDPTAHPAKTPDISDIFQNVQAINTSVEPTSPVNTSVEENSPDAVYKPWFRGDLLAELMKQTGIEDTKGCDEETWPEQQVTLGVTGDNLAVSQEKQYAQRKELPDMEVFDNSDVEKTDSFELENEDVKKLLEEDPDLNYVVSLKAESNDESAFEKTNSEVAHVIDLGDFTGNFAITDNDDMGPYRECGPPSVNSVVSTSTYTSDYPSVLSPGKQFEVLDEVSVSQAQVVTGRRGTRRRTSGGKDLKRLMNGPKPLMSSTGKPYPAASARNGKLSRIQYTDYTESHVHEGWWKMCRNVERMYQGKIDFQNAKVEDLRRYCHDLFAVALFTPADWGNNQKRKGIYREALKAKYRWDPNVPFCSLNNGANNKKQDKGDARRAKKEDLVQIAPYLMRRYEVEVRPEIQFKENGHLVRPVTLQENTTSMTQAVAPATSTISSGLDMAVTPKVESIATETKACDFPVPVTMATATETNNFIALETPPNSTVDLEELMECLGNNKLLTNDTVDFGSMNIEPRQTSQMDVDSENLYKYPEMKAESPKDEFVKVKLEHSYSIPDDQTEGTTQTLTGMSTYQDNAIPGTVLQLVEMGSNTSMIQSVHDDEYLVAKMQETHPDILDQVYEIMDQHLLKENGTELY